MELYQLQTFVAVAREGNLTRAAERLFTSQPAVSAQIKALESEFGLKLFERTSSGMNLTPAGEILWDEAERVLNAARDLGTRAAGLQGRVAGRLRVGFNNDGGILRSAETLAAMSTAHPELTFHIAYGASGALLQGVKSRDLDACFFEGTCDDETIELAPLTVFELVVVVPAEWADALQEPSWHKLAARPWAFVSPLCSYFRLIEQVTAANGVTIQPRFQVEEDATALQLVAAGTAISVTTMEALRHRGMDTSPRIALWPYFRHKLPLSLAYLANRTSDPVIAALRDAAQGAWSAAETPQSQPRIIALA